MKIQHVMFKVHVFLTKVFEKHLRLKKTIFFEFISLTHHLKHKELQQSVLGHLTVFINYCVTKNRQTNNQSNTETIQYKNS